MASSENLINRNNFNPVTDIWFHPTATLRYILENRPKENVNLLFVLGGIMNSVERALERADEDSRLFGMIVMAIVVGGAFGWISYYLVAYFLSGAGDWLKGKADSAEFRTVLAWSLVPVLTGALLFIPRIIIFSEGYGPNGVVEGSLQYIDAFLQFVQLCLGIWTFIILVKGVKIIQNFSTLRALLNIFLPILIIIGVILFFALVMKLGGVDFL